MNPIAAAANSRAVRISLLAAGLAGQLAIEPLVPLGVSLAGAVALVVVAGGSLSRPLIGTRPTRIHGWWHWQWRQIAALALMVVSGAELITHLHAGDAASQARMLATMLLLVQVAHAAASESRREAGLGCAVVLAMLAVAAVFAGDIFLLAPLVIAVGAIAVVAALLHRAASLDRADVAVAGPPAAVVRSCVAPVSLAVGLALVAFLALPDSARLHGRGPGNVSADSNSSHGDDRGRIGLSSDVLDLTARGPLSDAPALSTPVSAPKYWQGAIYADFDGMVWSATHHASEVWQPSGTLDGRPAEVPPPAAIDSSASGLAMVGVTRTDDVTVLGAGVTAGMVYSPGGLLVYAGPGRVVSDGDGAPHLFSADAGPIRGYLVSSVAPRVSVAELRAANGFGPVDPKWTAVPAAVAPRVRELAAQLTAGSVNRFDKVAAVENYLRANETYDLNSPEPARGDDAVDDFVFVSHRGFCEQFATAAVVMLRSVGIPARLVSGYAVGETTSDPGRRIFLGTDAHAWVQVYYPGVGWVDSDPTASGASLLSAASSRPSIRRQLADALTRLWRRLPGRRGGALVASCLAILLGAGLVLASGQWSRWRSRRRLVALSQRAGPALAAYLRLESALARHQRRREPGETLGEFAVRLGGSVAGGSVAGGSAAGGSVAGAADLAAAMRCVERDCYGRESRRPSAAESAAAVEVFDRVRAAVGREPSMAAGSSAATTAATTAAEPTRLP